MAFQSPITIARAVQAIHERKYVLPSIQRELEWNTVQMERLFDSVMRGYPIGSFLFWKVERQHSRDYQFYDFIRDFHRRDSPHNPKANVSGDEEVTAVLDGQQRLTALHIGLKGSHSERKKYGRVNDPDAFPKRRLYLNLLAPAAEEDRRWAFRFLTESEARNDHSSHWFRVGDILDLRATATAPYAYLSDAGLATNAFATESLLRLLEAINVELSINYFLEEDQDLEKVLDIFIRTNSGGTPLTYPQILMSIATAQWRSRDAREEIYGLVDSLNRIGDGYWFNKDFVLKAALVLSDAADIRFRVSNFVASNSEVIERNWDQIKKQLHLAVSLVDAFGFDGRTLTSSNAVIPIAYHLLRAQASASFVTSTRDRAQRDVIEHWLILSLLRGVFGQSGDTVLAAMRAVIRDADTTFPIDALARRVKLTGFEDWEVADLMTSGYGQGGTYPLLALLYPSLDRRNVFHQDHIFPKALATVRALRKAGLSDDDMVYVTQHVNALPNLQLIEGTPNQEKSATPFPDWLDRSYPDTQRRAAYKETHMVPDIDCTPANFRAFFEARRAKMIDRLRAALPAPVGTVAADEPEVA